MAQTVGTVLSQSAFAGYGLEADKDTTKTGYIGKSQSAFAGYGLKRILVKTPSISGTCRNPLSLDMG